MKILLLADEESKYLWDYFDKSKVEGIDLIISCGDLSPQYLSFLATFSHAPVLYVHGNHDVCYKDTPPGRELFRSTSKMIFQFPMFKENETRMPTTELLLWKNKLLSRSQIEQVHHKLQAQYGYLMLDEQQEYADELEARRNIVGAVGIMKEATRGNKMLLQCNYRYGYQRNLLGGLVWSFMIVLLLLIASYVYNLKYMAGCWLALIFVLIQGVVAFFFMKYAARNYARTLIITFISK